MSGTFCLFSIKKKNIMVIYDKEKKELNIPKSYNTTNEQLYRDGWARGYENGYNAGIEECENKQ